MFVMDILFSKLVEHSLVRSNSTECMMDFRQVSLSNTVFVVSLQVYNTQGNNYVHNL